MKTGSGYVKSAGPGVTVAKPGDAVLLSYDSCQNCQVCAWKRGSYCPEFFPLNFTGEYPVFSTKGHGENQEPNVSGRYFGQSSFANLSIVSQNSVVNVSSLVKSKQELQFFSPLGCGIQTGSGTVINVVKAGPEDIITIIGLGGVGLSAIAAAGKIAKCKKVIGIDKVKSRLDLAFEFGATDVIDGDNLPEGKTLDDVVKALSDGIGPTITIDTTGVPALIKAGFAFTRRGGRYVQVGTSPPDFQMEIPWFEFMMSGKQVLGAVEGQAKPSEYVPQMIQWYRDGKFPIDKMMKTFPVDKYHEGIEEMHKGVTIKPVIAWS